MDRFGLFGKNFNRVLNYFIKEWFIRMLYLISSVLGCFYIFYLYRHELVLNIIIKYLIELDISFQYTNLLEIFLLELKLNILICIVIFIILFSIYLFLFLLNGLYVSEVKLIIKKTCLSSILFIMFYVPFSKIVVKILLFYFLNLFNLENRILHIEFNPKIQDSIELIIKIYVFIALLSLLIFYILKKIGVKRLFIYSSLLLSVVILVPSDPILHLGLLIIFSVIIEIVIIIIYICKAYKLLLLKELKREGSA